MKIFRKSLVAIAVSLLATIAHASVYVGDTTQTGIRTGGVSTGQMVCTYFTAGASGTPTVGDVYFGNAGIEAYLVAYAFVSTTGGTLIEQSNLISSTTVGWNSFTFASSVTITSGSQYYLCVFTTVTTAEVGYGKTSVGSGNGMVYMNTAWPTAPTTFTKGGLLVGNNVSAYLGAVPPATYPVLSNGHALLSNSKPLVGSNF